MARARLPDNVHNLKGTYQPSRHGKKDQKLDLEARIPQKPKFIKGPAAVEWRRVTRILKDKGLLTILDRSVLAQYCVLYGKMSIEGEAFSAADHTQLRLICQELGFTPASRGKIVIKKPEDTGGFRPV